MVDACIRRLTDLCEKAGVEQTINEGCSFMSSVIDCRDQLVTLLKYTLSVKSPSARLLQ